EQAPNVLGERIWHLVPILAAVNGRQEDSRLLAVILLQTAAPGPAVLAIDKLYVIDWFGEIDLRRLPVPGLFVFHCVSVALGDPARAAIRRVQDVAVDGQCPTGLRVDEPDRANLVFELILDLAPGLSAVGGMEDFEALILLERIGDSAV